MAATAEELTGNALAREPVYVYGTDLGGNQQGEAATLAVQVYGAASRHPSGPSGHAYAIPWAGSTRQRLELPALRNYVRTFCDYARERSDASFHVSRFGCGPDGHGDKVLAGLFVGAPANCLLPGLWSAVLDVRQPVRLLVFDPGAHLGDSTWQRRLEQFLALNAPLWGASAVELVSVGHARTLVANDAAARALGLTHRIIAADAAVYGRHAATVAEHKAIVYATRMLCIIDFDQTAQSHQVRMMGAATRNGLPIDQVDSAGDD
ncbi:MAG: hypothetical protein RLW61_08050 [Gammaproteobacteria bacterium]